MDDKYNPEMPPVEGAAYLLGYLWELGPSMAANGYPGPAIIAWQTLTGIELQPWETGFLCRLSNEYQAESRRAEKAHCRPPWKSLSAIAKGD